MHIRARISVAAVNNMDTGSGLETAFTEGEGFAWAGAFRSVKEALRRLSRNAPDVILLEIKFFTSADIQDLLLLKSLRRETKVVVLTPLSEVCALRDIFAAGADGYLVKPLSVPEMIAAVRAACFGEVPVSPEAVRHLVHLVKPSRSAAEASKLLTLRELEVMNHVEVGRVDKEIAQLLNLSLQTVKRHLHNVYSKLGVGNRVEAVYRLRTPSAGS